MHRNRTTISLTLGSILVLTCALHGQRIGETPAITTHMNEAEIETGQVPFEQIVEHGRQLFTAVFNKLDGQGRPGTTADAEPRAPKPGMLRINGPEAHSCVSCHNRPRAGGGGDFATNVFVMFESVKPDQSNERNTLSLYGCGPIEMLAREMTWELRVIRLLAIDRAYRTFQEVPAKLVAKGIDFGTIVARPDGTVDTSGVSGVSPDLIVRPFHQNGASVSIRAFTNDAMNQHIGIQSAERFGIDVDADGDGIANELTVGDMTAISLFQAQLGTPGRVVPDDPVKRQAVKNGEILFNRIGCTNCHIPAMNLKNAMFTEANPFNPEWKLPVVVAKPVGFDMTKTGEKPRLESTGDGGAIVRAYTDLKRHNLCDKEDQFFCNEKVAQEGIALGTFLTRKLWDIGNSAPYGHRGDLSTLTEAIEHQAGEARPSRAGFDKLSAYERASIIEFLKTLQMLPPGSPLVVRESDLIKNATEKLLP